MHAENIRVLREIGEIVQGRTETMYNPSALTTREQMATFMTRTLDAILSDELRNARRLPVEER